MLPALVTLKSLIKAKSYHIDFPFFRLHYQATVVLLLSFCLILTAKLLFGDTIDCVSSMKGVGDLYDNMCYSVGTYTKYKLHNISSESLTAFKYIQLTRSTNMAFRVDPESRYFHPGIPVAERDVGVILWHDYYQYIPIMLFIQSVMFYFPHYLWKVWENGIVSSICKRLYENRFSPADYLENNYDLIYYLQNCFKFNKSLVYKYFFCNVLLLLNLVVQILTLNTIFNYQFITYGLVVFQYIFINEDVYGMRRIVDDQLQRNLNNPMDTIFPKVTACRINLGSQGGSQTNKYDFLCVLPLNILHDKFFLVLWFWFAVLSTLTVLQIVYYIVYTTLPFFRKQIFIKRYGSYLWDMDGKHKTTLTEIFLLDLIGCNTDKYVFSALLRKLNKEDWTASPSENHSTV